MYMSLPHMPSALRAGTRCVRAYIRVSIFSVQMP